MTTMTNHEEGQECKRERARRVAAEWRLKKMAEQRLEKAERQLKKRIKRASNIRIG